MPVKLPLFFDLSSVDCFWSFLKLTLVKYISTYLLLRTPQIFLKIFNTKGFFKPGWSKRILTKRLEQKCRTLSNRRNSADCHGSFNLAAFLSLSITGSWIMSLMLKIPKFHSPRWSSQGIADGITVGLVQCRFYGNLDIKEYFKNVPQNEFSLYETYLVISHNVFGFYSHICEV